MAKNLQDAGAGIFDVLTGAKDIPAAKGAQGMQEKQQPQTRRHLRTERLYFKVTPEVKGYLQRAALEASTPTRRVSMTDYVCMLVERDMEQHPEYMPEPGNEGE